MPVKVAINGFGRIGRNILRVQTHCDDIEITSINDIAPAATLAHLLKYDSIHGKFNGEIEVDGENIVIDGQKIRVFSERDPSNIPWPEGTWCVLECTGLFRSAAKASAHLKSGVEKVILSAPGQKSKPEDMEKYGWGKEEVDGTFVMGVNHQLYDPENHRIVSNASCTTNCLAPVVKVLNDHFGIEHGFMTTIHSLTNDQRILDLAHKDLRRARAAGVNIIPTTTGAAKAVSLVIPELKDKLDGGAVRVPTLDGSLVDLVAVLNTDVTVDLINETMKRASLTPEFHGILEYSEEPLVSSDILQNEHSSIFDGLSTKVMEGRLIKCLSWYDNEWGYAARLLDLICYMNSRQK